MRAAGEERREGVDADGLWCGVEAARERTAGRPALFLDRDGVLVEETHYLSDPEDVRLLAGAPELVAAANRAGVPVVVVTNQAGIGRGYYGWDSFAAVQERLKALLAAAGARWDAVLACPFHPDAREPWRHPDHPARKPNPGMLLRAREELGVELRSSWIVGDTLGDVLAGRNARLSGAVHVLTGHGRRDRDAVAALRGFEVRLADTVAELGSLPAEMGDVAAGGPFTSLK